MEKKIVSDWAKYLKNKTGCDNCKQTAHHGKPSIKCSFARKGACEIQRAWHSKHPWYKVSTLEEARAKDEAYEIKYNAFVFAAYSFAGEHRGEVIITDNTKPNCVGCDDRVVRIIFE